MSGMGNIFSQNWTFPNRTDRRSSKRPAYVRYLPIQPWTDDFKSRRRGENWLASSLWGLRGTPRYVKRKLPSLKPDIERIACFWAAPTPPKKMDDFCGLISKPDVLPKRDSCLRRHWTEEESPRERSKTSSAKARWLIPCNLHLGWKRKPSCWEASLCILEKYSIQQMKMYGDNGSPCLTPLFPKKKPWMSPLTATEKEAVDTHCITRVTNLAGKPRWQRRFSINPHWTESNAFLKSTFNKQRGDNLFLPYWRRMLASFLIWSLAIQFLII